MPSLLADHVAVVTGGSGGIGRAIAVGLAREGASLCLVGRRADALERVAAHLRPSGARVLCYPTDLISDDLCTLRHFVCRNFAHVDVLVHGAGVLINGSVAEIPARTLDLLHQINVRAPYELTQVFLPLLTAEQGQVVFLNSSLLTARANTGQYAATKHALKAIADSLREEVNSLGVRVISVYPGRVAGEMQEKLHAMEGRPYRPELLLQPEDVAAVVIHALTLPPTAEVTDVHIRPMQKA